jgi:hypothetical protein
VPAPVLRGASEVVISVVSVVIFSEGSHCPVMGVLDVRHWCPWWCWFPVPCLGPQWWRPDAGSSGSRSQTGMPDSLPPACLYAGDSPLRLGLATHSGSWFLVTVSRGFQHLYYHIQHGGPARCDFVGSSGVESAGSFLRALPLSGDLRHPCQILLTSNWSTELPVPCRLLFTGSLPASKFGRIAPSWCGPSCPLLGAWTSSLLVH